MAKEKSTASEIYATFEEVWKAADKVMMKGGIPLLSTLEYLCELKMRFTEATIDEKKEKQRAG